MADVPAEGKPDAPPDPRVRYFMKQLDDIDLEIVRQSALCGLAFKSRDQLRADLMRVLENDKSVCPKASPNAFAMLRAAVTMHLTVRDKAIASMGRTETTAIIDEVVARLAKRVGLKQG